ncbi:hypothetical protein [Halomonas sp. M20]|uniref:hypothetical protein n=1 Tax=Halomonas sp. M20 TaxID=2763264 RepID=UPI001D0ABB0A|nr:hypothetical protein [Halomonas sp. M20]
MAKFTALSRLGAVPALGLAILVMLPMPVFADDESVYIRQIVTEKRLAVAEESQVAAFSTPGVGTINEIDVDFLDELALRGNGRRSSTVLQRGQRNRAVVSVKGGNNATFQRQVGVALDSSIQVAGTRNVIAVDQKGVGLESDINVLGANKQVVHIQRGSSANNGSAPLLYTGSSKEVELIIDTSQGRVTRPLTK